MTSDAERTETDIKLQELLDGDLLERVDDLVGALTKPLYTYRMSGGMTNIIAQQERRGYQASTGRQRAAKTQHLNAAREIDRIVSSYCASVNPPEVTQ